MTHHLAVALEAAACLALLHCPVLAAEEEGCLGPVQAAGKPLSIVAPTQQKIRRSTLVHFKGQHQQPMTMAKLCADW